MKNIFNLALVMLLSALSGKASAQSGDFVTKWNLATNGSGANQLKINTNNSGTLSYSWTEVSPGTASGNGTFTTTGTTVTQTISGLPTGATIRLRIEPTNLTRFAVNIADDKRLVEVEQWGTAAWTSFHASFRGCYNLTNISATDIPNLSSTTAMQNMFEDCRKLSNVTNIGSWNVSNVTNMSNMFLQCYVFNQDISGWNTANVTTMQSMFSAASIFNQNLGSWTLKSNVTLNGMLQHSGMRCANYEATLIGWSTQSTTGRTLNALNCTYGSAANAARAILTGTKGWTITGDVSSNECDNFVTTWDLATAGSGANQLKINTNNSGTLSYSWTEVGGSGSGAGTFTTTGASVAQTISGLPTGATIRLRIEPTNLTRFAVNIDDDKRLVEVEQWGSAAWTSFQASFRGCYNLNISATGIPNLSSTTNMENMFASCRKLSNVPNIGSWDVSNVTNMSNMFLQCYKFNQDISGWNTANVVTMQSMFSAASIFNQNLGSWTLKSTVTLTGMLGNCGMDCDNYSATLIGWNSQSVTGRTLGATGRTYANGLAARANLVLATGSGGKGWTISSDAVGTCSAPSVPGLEDQTAMNEVIGKASIWPNPVADMLNIEINEIYQDEKLYLTVTDMKGSVLMSQTVTHGNSAISTAGWPNALYVVTLRSEHDIILISKISKQ